MRKFVIPALAGLAALSAAALAPSKADAQVAIGFGIATPGYVTPVQWGGYYGYRPYRPYYGYGRPYRPYYGYYRPYRPCWVERRWVDTPWGPRPRPVRVCR